MTVGQVNHHGQILRSTQVLSMTILPQRVPTKAGSKGAQLQLQLQLQLQYGFV